MVTVIEDAAPEKRAGVLLTFDFDAIPDFTDDPEDREGDEVIDEEGDGGEKDVVLMHVAKALGEGFLLDGGPGEVIVQRVFVVHDLWFLFHGVLAGDIVSFILPLGNRARKKRLNGARFLGCGGWLRSIDLQVMGLASYRAALPRDIRSLRARKSVLAGRRICQTFSEGWAKQSNALP